MRDRIEGPNSRRTSGKGRPFVACALLGLALAVLPAAAQVATPGQVNRQAPSDIRGLPSDRTAILLSAAGTAAAVLSVFASHEVSSFSLVPLFAGPSLGAMYGGLWGRALLFTGLRLVGTYAFAIAASSDEAGIGLAYAWIAGMSLSAVIEIATIGKAVHDRNERRLARRGIALGVSPFAVPKGAGLNLSLSF
jgi:hypothetical protein